MEWLDAVETLRARREPGGGNLEAKAVERARELLTDRATTPELLTSQLTDEVTVLLEPLAVLPAVAIFGMGHVGIELARILARHDLDLHLVDSRPEQLTDRALRALDDAVARVHRHHVPVLPELVLGELLLKAFALAGQALRPEMPRAAPAAP